MKVSFVNQNPIVDIEFSSFFNMKWALFIVNTFDDILDVIVYYSYLI